MEQSKQTYKKQGNISLFDSEETMDRLNSLGNPLEKLSRVVDFEMFREDLETGLYKEKFTNVGAQPYDYVLMFKILVLQRMYHLSDEQTEYQIRDAVVPRLPRPGQRRHGSRCENRVGVQERADQQGTFRETVRQVLQIPGGQPHDPERGADD